MGRTKEQNRLRHYARTSTKAKREKYNKMVREYQQRAIVKYRNEILSVLGAVCVHCGYADKRALDIDRIQGGHSKMKQGKNPLWVLREIIKNLADYRVLCRNCNWIAWIERSTWHMNKAA